VVALGLPAAVRIPAARPLLVLAAGAELLPALLATGPGQAALEWMVTQCPVWGLFAGRTESGWPAMPGYALAGAGWPGSAGRRAVVGAAALIAVLPDLAWGVGGQLRAVSYPPGWPAVAAIVNADPRPVAVLGQDSMRRFDWSGSAPVLDPLPRWVSADVLASAIC
jgi:hypothetical protein